MGKYLTQVNFSCLCYNDNPAEEPLISIDGDNIVLYNVIHLLSTTY